MPQYETFAASPESPDFAAYAGAAWTRLVRTALLLTGDFHEAEDLVQTTLAKVYARWGRIPPDDVDFYVRRSLVNNNLSRTRRRRVTHLLMPFLPERVHEPDNGHAESVERRAAITEALGTLSTGSGRCWCCATGRTSPRPRSPNFSTALSGRSRPMRDAVSRLCAPILPSPSRPRPPRPRPRPPRLRSPPMNHPGTEAEPGAEHADTGRLREALAAAAYDITPPICRWQPWSAAGGKSGAREGRP